jgi:hypothetical protein
MSSMNIEVARICEKTWTVSAPIIERAHEHDHTTKSRCTHWGDFSSTGLSSSSTKNGESGGGLIVVVDGRDACTAMCWQRLGSWWEYQEVGGPKSADIKLRSADDGKSILSRFKFGPQSFSTSVLSTQMLVYRKSELQDHPHFHTFRSDLAAFHNFLCPIHWTIRKLHRTELAVFGPYKQRVGWRRGIRGGQSSQFLVDSALDSANDSGNWLARIVGELNPGLTAPTGILILGVVTVWFWAQ